MAGKRRSPAAAAAGSSGQPQSWWRRLLPDWLGTHFLLPVVAGVVAGVVLFLIQDKLFGKDPPPPTPTPTSTTATATTPASNPAPSTTKPPLIVTPAAFKPAYGFPSRGVVVPRPPNKIPRPPPYATFVALSDWAEPLKGVAAEQLTTTLVLERAQTSGVVIVTDVRPVVKRRLPAVSGTWVAPYGGGGQPYRWIVYDLEADPPRVTEKGNNPGGDPKWTFPLRVSSADPEVVLVIGKARNHLIEWELDVEYFYQGTQYKTTIKDHGKPFRTTGVTGFPRPIFPPANATDPWP